MGAASEQKMFRILDVIAAGVVDLRQELHTEIGVLRNEMHNEIGGLRGELHFEIDSLRNEMNTGFSRVERRLGYVETRVGSLEGEFRNFRTATSP